MGCGTVNCHKGQVLFALRRAFRIFACYFYAMDFNFELVINATPEEVFAALTVPFQIELWSGYPAEMKAEKGYEFSLWEGDIMGMNLNVIPNKRLVQEWYFGDQEEHSIVSLDLKRDREHTRVVLHHTHIPDEVYEEITEGWKKYYLGAIKDMLEMY